MSTEEPEIERGRSPRGPSVTERNEDNLLVRLMSYRPRPKRNPREDFLTEVFAHLLRTVPGLARHLFTALLKERSPRFSDRPAVTTQEGLGSEGRVDLAVPTEDGARLLIENKLGAPLEWKEHEGSWRSQVSEYARWAQAQRTPGVVILLSSFEMEVGKDGAGTDYPQHRWWEVYRELTRFEIACRLDPVSQYLLEQFLRLLEALGMEPFAGLTTSGAAAVGEFLDYEKQSEKLLKQVVARLPPKFHLPEHSKKQPRKTRTGWWFQEKFDFGPPAEDMDLGVVYKDPTSALVALLVVYGEEVVNKLGEPLEAAGFEKPWYNGWHGLCKARRFAPDHGFFRLDPDAQEEELAKFFAGALQTVLTAQSALQSS